MSTSGDTARPARRAAAPAWPGLLIGLVLPLGLMFGLFWLRASLPESNFGRGEADAVLRYWLKVLVICVTAGGALWAALWYGWLARTGRDIGLTLLAIVLVGTFGGAVGAVQLKREANAGPRRVAEMESQWARTQDRDVNSLIGELNAIRVRETISPRAIVKDKDLSEARERLARARAAVAKHRRWREERIETYRAKIATLAVDAATRQRVISAFERQREQTEVIVMEFHGGIEDSLLQAEALTIFLHRSRGRWRAQGDRFLFGSASDYEYFNRGVRHYDAAFDSQARARWDLRGNPLLARDQDLFPDVKPPPRHNFVLF